MFTPSQPVAWTSFTVPAGGAPKPGGGLPEPPRPPRPEDEPPPDGSVSGAAPDPRSYSTSAWLRIVWPITPSTSRESEAANCTFFSVAPANSNCGAVTIAGPLPDLVWASFCAVAYLLLIMFTADSESTRKRAGLPLTLACTIGRRPPSRTTGIGWVLSEQAAIAGWAISNPKAAHPAAVMKRFIERLPGPCEVCRLAARRQIELLYTGASTSVRPTGGGGGAIYFLASSSAWRRACRSSLMRNTATKNSHIARHSRASISTTRPPTTRAGTATRRSTPSPRIDRPTAAPTAAKPISEMKARPHQ